MFVVRIIQILILCKCLFRYGGVDVADYEWLFEYNKSTDWVCVDDEVPQLFRSMILKQYSMLSRNSTQLYKEATTCDVSLNKERINDLF